MIMGNTMPLRDPDEDEEDEGEEEEEEEGEERADEPPLVREPDEDQIGLSGGCPSAPKRGSSRP